MTFQKSILKSNMRFYLNPLKNKIHAEKFHIPTKVYTQNLLEGSWIIFTISFFYFSNMNIFYFHR